MPHSKPESKLIRAAGAVAWRPGPDGEPEILLVHRSRYDDWSLPKGKTDPGEPLPVTAVREVLEEGGARLTLGRRLASVKYKVGGRPKRVHYWVARVTSTDSRAVPNAEVDEIAWVPASRAAERVSYPHDRGVLADFARHPVGTTALILLRHAKAQPKSGWKRDDTRRPLDDSGQADAKILADLLTCFAPGARLVSSPAVRCVETLRPLAELSGVPVREDPSLMIQSPGTEPADYTQLIASALGAGTPTVICAHRENIPALQAAALAALGAGAAAAAGAGAAAGAAAGADAAAAAGPAAGLPGEWSVPLPTAGFWVLNVVPPPPPPPPPPASAPAEPRGRRSRLRGAVPLRGRLPWRLRGRPGAAGDAGEGGAPAAGNAAGDAPGGAASPAGILVSADRYDLAGT